MFASFTCAFSVSLRLCVRFLMLTRKKNHAESQSRRVQDEFLRWPGLLRTLGCAKPVLQAAAWAFVSENSSRVFFDSVFQT